MLNRLILIAAFSWAGAASAQDITAEQRAACTPDAMRLCASEIPDVGRVTACMKANRAHLSARCQATFASASQSHASPPPERRVETAHVAASHAAIRHRRYAVAGYGYRHRGHAGYGDYGQSAQAMAIARQIMGGLAVACGNGSLPPEVCSSMSSSMASMGAGLAGLGGTSGMSPY
jgi:hypothetical protein